MNPRRLTLALCAASLFLLVGVPALTAQLADVPVKPGLWNTQVIVKMGPGGDNQPVTSQACFTGGTTISSYLTTMTKSAPGLQCTVSNMVQAAHHVAFDTTCTSSTLTSKSHSDFQLADSEHFSGTTHATIAGNSHGHPINMEIDKTSTATFQSPNCGDVKPLTSQPAPEK